MKELYWITIYALIFSPLLGVAVFLLNSISLKIYMKRHTFHLVIGKNERVRKDKCLSIILLLSLVSFTTDMSNLVCVRMGYQGNAINNTYNLLQFIGVSAFYHYLHEPQAIFRKRKVVGIGIVVYMCVFLINVFMAGSFQHYLTQPRVAGNLILVVYSIYTFIRLRGGPLVDDRQMSALGEDMYSTIVKIVSAPVWFNVGVLVYFGGSLIITLIETYIQPQLFSNPVYVKQAYTIWIIHNLLNISKNSFFAIGIYHAVKYGMARRRHLPPAKYTPLEAN